MNLGKVLSSWRWAEKLTLREAAAHMGTSAATLLRIERGLPMDGDTLAKIITWLIAAPGDKS